MLNEDKTAVKTVAVDNVKPIKTRLIGTEKFTLCWIVLLMPYFILLHFTSALIGGAGMLYAHVKAYYAILDRNQYAYNRYVTLYYLSFVLGIIITVIRLIYKL